MIGQSQMDDAPPVWKPRTELDREMEAGGSPYLKTLRPEVLADIEPEAPSHGDPTVDELAHLLDQLAYWDSHLAAKWLLHHRATNRERAAIKSVLDLLEEPGLQDSVDRLEARP